MRRQIHLQAAVFFLCTALTTQAQPATSAGEGREFWLAFQKNFRDFVTDQQTSGQRPAEPLQLELAITSQQKTRGVVEIAGIGFRQEFTVTPGEVTRVVIDKAAQLRNSRIIQRLGVHVTADAPISVYGLSRRFQTTDTYAAIPVHLLGTSYRAVGYGWLENDLLSQLAIVATEDNTVVTITPSVAVAGEQIMVPVMLPVEEERAKERESKDPSEMEATTESLSAPISISMSPALPRSNSPDTIRALPRALRLPNRYYSKESDVAVAPKAEQQSASVIEPALRRPTTIDTLKVITRNQPAGEPIHILLHRGETYQVIAAFDPSTSSDLTGSLITSPKPIAVFSGHNCAYVPDKQTKACNLLVEQLPPLSAWGRTFAVGTIAGRSWSVVRVIAMADGTEVTRDSTTTKVLNDGEFFDYTTVTSATLITTSQPALVAQFSPGFDNGDNVGDPMMLLVPPVEQFTTTYRFATPIEGSWHHYVNIIAPTSAIRDITIDDLPLGTLEGNGITQVGDGTFSVAQVEVPSGSHVVSGNEPFGVYQYGHGYDAAAYDAYGNGGGQEYRNLQNAGK